METILQGLMDLGGVSAALVLDPGGRVVGQRAHAVYDRATCEHVGGAIAKAVDSIQLHQDDWDAITAQFADGRLLVRRLGGGGGRGHVLAVVADATLNASFATVALRVAVNKLRALVDGSAAASGIAPSASGVRATPPPVPPRPGASSVHAPPPVPAASAPAAAPPGLSTGVSWARSSNLGSSAGMISGVAVADPASGAFLTRAVKELARHVGPIAKVYVQEAVRRVSPEAPFSLALATALQDDLAGQIEDSDDRAEFLRALRKA
jgi:predicted regulator of Ras-like GTPase activity (Roadblock/LC7/MglB family)